MWALWPAIEYNIRGKVEASPESGSWWSSVSMLPVVRPSTKGASNMH
jgi:hypothetical protein